MCSRALERRGKKPNTTAWNMSETAHLPKGKRSLWETYWGWQTHSDSSTLLPCKGKAFVYLIIYWILPWLEKSLWSLQCGVSLLKWLREDLESESVKRTKGHKVMWARGWKGRVIAWTEREEGLGRGTDGKMQQVQLLLELQEQLGAMQEDLPRGEGPSSQGDLWKAKVSAFLICAL